MVVSDNLGLNAPTIITDNTCLRIKITISQESHGEYYFIRLLLLHIEKLYILSFWVVHFAIFS